jgi:short-subunit dehydrogenase
MTIIKGKTVLLTGASRGLGVYMARNLAKEQATVVCVSRSESGLAQTCAEINALGSKAISIPFDVKNLEGLSSLAQQVNEVAGPVDILINNAGIEIHRIFADYSLEEIQSVLTTNLLSVMELTRQFLPSMLERRSGHIVNIASLAGKKGVAYSSIYSASKAGLIMWTDAIRQELAASGIKVSAICPGYVCEAGMTVDSCVPIPKLAGASKPINVANAIIKAIKRNEVEVIINENVILEYFTKQMFAIGQISPRLVDHMYRWMGVVELNQKRVESLEKSEYLGIDSPHK